MRELLEEWTAFRVECVRRRTHFDLEKKREKLHLLQGLELILLDIDKAIRIVRETEEEAEVVPNLMTVSYTHLTPALSSSTRSTPWAAREAPVLAADTTSASRP